jgi:hypothetical protein
MVFNIAYPEDIEGLWTYVHFAHSMDEKRSTGFIKYGADGKVATGTSVADHTPLPYLRFILAGK